MTSSVDDFRPTLVELYGDGQVKHPADVPASRRKGMIRDDCEQLARDISDLVRQLDVRITEDSEYGARWLIELALEFRGFHFIDLAGVSVSQLAPVAAVGFGSLEIFEGDVPPFDFERVRAYYERHHQSPLPEEYQDRARTIEQVLDSWGLQVLDWPTLQQPVSGFTLERTLVAYDGPPTLFELLFTTA